MDRSCASALPVLALIVAGCGPGARSTATAGRTQPAERPFAAGKPLVPRAVEVGGIPGTVELRVERPGRPASPSVFVTLGRTVAREPKDVCFGTYVAHENPEEGDVSCQVRGTDPLILALGSREIRKPFSRFTTISGQVNGNVDRVRLIGPGATDTSLPLSAHRMFLVAFSPTARGTFRLLARLAHGASFTHAFTLPLAGRDAGVWPGLRRRGAIFNYGIGENIVSRSYRQILEQFGPPLKAFVEPPGVRCVYYDVVGHKNGWRFCFKGQTMVSGTGEYPPPAGSVPSVAPSTALTERPWIGVACPAPVPFNAARAIAIARACDRVGLAISLRTPAVTATATINGQSFKLDSPAWSGPPIGGKHKFVAGFLQHARFLRGPFKAVIFRNGVHQRFTIEHVQLVIGYGAGREVETSLTELGHGGWG